MKYPTVEKILAAGEMSSQDLEPGGDWYEVRMELEDVCKDAGITCKVLPFDQYQGPYAQLANGGRLWKTDEGFFFEAKPVTPGNFTEPRGTQFVGDHDEMVEFLFGLDDTGTTLHSTLQKILAGSKFQWVIEENKKFVDSFDDYDEAAKEFDKLKAAGRNVTLEEVEVNVYEDDGGDYGDDTHWEDQYDKDDDLHREGR
jgi:hypothetical protein